MNAFDQLMAKKAALSTMRKVALSAADAYAAGVPLDAIPDDNTPVAPVTPHPAVTNAFADMMGAGPAAGSKSVAQQPVQTPTQSKSAPVAPTDVRNMTTGQLVQHLYKQTPAGKMQRAIGMPQNTSDQAWRKGVAMGTALIPFAGRR